MNAKIILFFRSLKEVYFACPKYNSAMALCLLIVGIMPAINVYTTAQLISLFETTHIPSSVSVSTQSQSSIIVVIALWGISMLVPTLLTPLVNFLQSHINQLVTHRIITQLMKKNASFRGLHAYDNAEIQDSTAVLQNQSKFRPTNFSVNLVTITREIITVLALSFMLFSIKWWIPFAVLFSFIPLAYINFQVTSFSWQALMKTGKHSRLMDYFSSLFFSREAQKDIHLFNAYDLITHKYNSAFNHVYGELKKAQFNIFIRPIPFQCLSVIVMAIVLFSLYEQNQASAISMSSAVILLQSIFILNNRLEGLIQHGSLLYEILDYFKKYFAFLDYSSDIKDGTLPIQHIEHIEFVNVAFKYPDTDTYILNNISFLAHMGESIAIVGHNGAGKTTLVHLICRFWDVTQGHILINGRDIRLYKISDLRHCIGAVFQDFFKFNMSINENITLNHNAVANPNNINITNELGLPADLPMNTLIGKSYGGIELSGGQWQKLAILRGLNANSSMIILDEPTSAIDPKSEVKLYDDFKTLSRGKLSFMITHRLGSINGVDRVLVLDKGYLVQDDIPDNLKNTEGVFKQLWDIQFAMYH